MSVGFESDANNPDYVFVAIEAGALIQSRDGGRTWIDRVEQGPYDTHTLVTHPRAPRRLYSSAGDGYYESFDYGESWSRPMEGMKHGYLFGLAVDSGDPQVVIVSASVGPGRAYSIENAESFVYRRDEDGKKWNAVSNGLPRPSGTTITLLAEIQKLRVNSMLLTTVAYSSHLIQAYRGKKLTSNGQKNISYNLPGLLQLGHDLAHSKI